MKEVFESVLQNLPVQELHRSCNGVLQEDFASVVAAVDHVAEAFAKLEEVSEAVARLHQGHKSTGRSASMMETTANSIRLQQTIEQRLAVLADRMVVKNCSEKKRKREEISPRSSPKVGAKDENMSGSEANERCELSSTNSSEVSASLESGNTKAEMTKKGTEQNGLSEVTKIQNEVIGTDAAHSATVLVAITDGVNQLSEEDRAFVVPDVVIALKKAVEDDKEMTQVSAVASSLDVTVQWWAQASESQMRHLQEYQEYAAVLKAYVARLPPSEDRTRVTRQLGALTSSIKAAKSAPKPSTLSTRAQSPPTFNFSKLAGSLKKTQFEKRQAVLVHLLVAFKQDTISRKIADNRGKRILQPMTNVFRWMFQHLREPYHVNACRVLVGAAQRASSRISGGSARRPVIELLDRMSAALTDPSSRETRKFLDDIRNETTSVLNRLKRHRSVADQEVLTLIAVVKKLVDHTAYGWDARQDLTAQECVKELKNIVGKTSQWKPQHSEDLLRSIAKWNINDPPLT